jgi:hypothetical protein
MYFFAETSKTITQSTPLGSWNVAGYQQINLHALVQGGSGSVYMELYFNNLSAAQEKLTIGPVGPGGWNIATLTKTYPVYAPTLSIVLYNPSTQMDFKLRLYSACCEPSKGFLTRLFGARAAKDGEAHRELDTKVVTDELVRAPDQQSAS